MHTSFINKIILIASVAMLCACGGRKDSSYMEDGDTLSLSYATRLSIVKYKGFTEVYMSDPWETGKTLHRYLLVPSDQDLPDDLPEGTVVRTPLRKAVISTSVHCGLVIRLGKKESIAGICEPQYIHIPWILDGVKNGRIADCGSGLSPMTEKIVDLQPDAIFLSPFQNSGGYGQLERTDIPIIETADYMETSALGRAEWMKFYGLLFGAEADAYSLFQEVESSYKTLSSIAKADKSRLTVMMDKPTGSVWYVPGGRSTIGKLISDTYAIYPWSKDEESGSLELSFESVLDKARDADLWLFRYNSPHDITYEELLSENDGFKQFRAFKQRKCYGCNTATTNFYEDTPFSPDKLLRDFLIITHHGLIDGEPQYFKPIQ